MRARLKRLEVQAPSLRPSPVLFASQPPTEEALEAFRQARGVDVVVVIPHNGRTDV